jgi:hypothetical protein
LSGQETVVDVARGEVDGDLQRVVGVRDAMVGFVLVAETLEDLDRLGGRRRLDVDGLEARSSAPSFSMCLRYSSSVVAPMHWISPRDSAGLSTLLASIAPSGAACADERVQLVDEEHDVAHAAHSVMTALMRSSNWPRYFVPATISARSSTTMRLLRRMSGTRFSMICVARPSTIAVLPTPGSPRSTGCSSCGARGSGSRARSRARGR